MSEAKKAGRKSTYTDETANTVIEQVSAGVPLAQACRDIGLGLTTWYDWAAARPEIAERIARAREAGFDMIAVDALKIADTQAIGERRKQTEDGLEVVTEDMLGHRKLQVETRLKLLAKWDPKRYGDKLALGGAADLPPIQSNVTIDAAEAYKTLLGGGNG